MSTSNTTLQVADLDFISIKENLKTFLKSQTEFTDYNFEGSGLNVLLDLLAYNTYYNSFYLNMVANESFLDTAQIRKNVLSLSKTINYVPMSSQGALSKVNILVTPSATENQTLNVLTLDRYTSLVGSDIEGMNYPFVTINANTSSKVNGTFSFANVFIKQGEVITRTFTMSSNNSSRSFEIPSTNIDTSTLTVTVQQSSSNTSRTEYTVSTDITEVQANSTVFFLEENENEQYKIQFGDNVIGKRPANGNIIIVTYLDTLGTAANNISDFRFIESIGGTFFGNVRVTTSQSSYGGTDKETIEQIRFRAPYHYVAQNRAVTKNDYQSLIIKDYNNIDSVTVWGGEENDPPVYGKTYISLKTKGYYTLTDLEKQVIKDKIIRSRGVLTVTPEIVDPDYCFILIRGKVTYNPNLTTRTSGEILNLIKQSIESYNNTELNEFGSIFKNSKLHQYIESAEPSITGSDVYVYIQKQQLFENNKSRNYVIKFNEELKKGGINEKLFSYPQITVIDSFGNLRDVLIEEVPESFTGVSSVTVLNPGVNYTEAPIVQIIGDGSGATAEATIVNRRVSTVKITNEGFNYTRATVAFSGGGDGSGATASALIRNSIGTLRTFYYRPNGEKVIVNNNAGKINYLTGSIELTSMLTTKVILNPYYDENVVTLNVTPDNEILYPSRNRLFAIDMNNPQSIQLELVEGL